MREANKTTIIDGEERRRVKTQGAFVAHVGRRRVAGGQRARVGRPAGPRARAPTLVRTSSIYDFFSNLLIVREPIGKQLIPLVPIAASHI